MNRTHQATFVRVRNGQYAGADDTKKYYASPEPDCRSQCIFISLTTLYTSKSGDTDNVIRQVYEDMKEGFDPPLSFVAFKTIVQTGGQINISEEYNAAKLVDTRRLNFRPSGFRNQISTSGDGKIIVHFESRFDVDVNQYENFTELKKQFKIDEAEGWRLVKGKRRKFWSGKWLPWKRSISRSRSRIRSMFSPPSSASSTSTSSTDSLSTTTSTTSSSTPSTLSPSSSSEVI